MNKKLMLTTSLQGIVKGIKVAIKEHKEDIMSGSAFRKEAETMKELQHPNIVRVYGVCTSKPYSIVMELLPEGSLINVLRCEKGDALKETDMRNVASQVRSNCSDGIINVNLSGS